MVGLSVVLRENGVLVRKDPVGQSDWIKWENTIESVIIKDLNV